MEKLFGQDLQWSWTIIRFLMFRSKILEDISLIKGKMGVVILFCAYSRFAAKPKFEQLADEQMEFVINIPEDMETGLDGLCGIGWGILYLYRHGYLTGSPDKLLMPLDDMLICKELHNEEEQHDIDIYHNYRSGDFSSEKVILNKIWTYWNYEYTKNHSSDLGQS